MPRYAPLPRIELDPRTEAELVKAAARRVYEASSSTLNDFSSGSPIMALLEGQSFAQGEFLQFANQFPESVLVEWIGPFLGAQRRTGAGAQVDITFNIDPIDGPFVVFEGYQVATDSNLTGGDSLKFVTLERLTIPPGSIQGTVRAIAIETGTKGNVAANTITKSLSSLAGVRSIINEEPSFGGQDAELLSEVKERFFSLIRRRNPVSAEDWTDWFSDALGTGTTVSVLPRHSERGIYNYGDDYISSNPSVSFFVLNPDGTPITPVQKDALETLMKWSLPIEFLGYIYPMEVDDVDINLTLEYDPAKPYSQNLFELSSILRDSLFSVMTPNAVFPIEYDPSVLDVQNAVSATFPVTLGVGNRFTDPNIKNISVYYPPTDVGVATFENVVPLEFETGGRFKEGDLVVEYLGGETFYYPVITEFDPNNNDKRQYVNNGQLEMKIIQPLVAGSYKAGDVLSFSPSGNIHVALTSFFFQESDNPSSLIRNGFVSQAKEFTPFNGEIRSTDFNNAYNPDLISYDQDDSKYIQFIYPEPAHVAVNKRIGNPVFVAKTSFFVEGSVNTLGEAQTQNLVQSDAIVMNLLEDGGSYEEGTYVKTPNENDLRSGVVSRSVCYITEAEGLKEGYFLVEKNFTYVLENEAYTDKVEELTLNQFLKPVDSISFSDCGRSIYKDKPFRYSARFKIGEYLRYREKGGFSSAELEDCIDESQASDVCNALLSNQLPVPRYYQALRDFTPYTTDVDKLVEDGVMTEVGVDIFKTTYDQTLTVYLPAQDKNINDALLESETISSLSDLEEGDTLTLTSVENHDRGVWRFVNKKWEMIMAKKNTFRDIFRLAPGDVVSFRQESTVKSYRATKHFTPVFAPLVYIRSGDLVDDGLATANRQWVDPTYEYEDFVYELANGAYSFYRVIAPTTPDNEELAWNNQIADGTPRLSELKGRLLKVVVGASCSDEIFSRLRDNASAVKLGVTNLTLRSKDSLGESEQYVWEATQYGDEIPTVSFSPTITAWDYKPINYGDGTLAL
jgi:hypothetical protein